jgi:hypothetical protein
MAFTQKVTLKEQIRIGEYIKDNKLDIIGGDDFSIVDEIVKELFENYSTTSKLATVDRPIDSIKVGLFSTIIKQNWIIRRKLSEISDHFNSKPPSVTAKEQTSDTPLSQNFDQNHLDASQEDDWQERQLCPDESCTGTLAKDGLCRVCGRSASGD